MKRALAVLGSLLLAGCWNPAETADSRAAAVEARRGTAPYVHAHTMQALMADIVDPQAQLYWRSSGSVSDGGGTRDLTPTTEEGWQAARTAAATVAEMGNVMLTPLHTAGRGPDWISLSQAMIAVAQKAEAAAAARDGEAMFATGGALYETCAACHQTYPPKRPLAENTGAEHRRAG